MVQVNSLLTRNLTVEMISLFFDVLLTVHLSIFISVFNQHDALNLFHNDLYFMPLHVSSTFAPHQEVKIALHSLWYCRMRAVLASYNATPHNRYQPHQAELEQYTKCSNTVFVLLKMGIMMPETC